METARSGSNSLRRRDLATETEMGGREEGAVVAVVVEKERRRRRDRRRTEEETIAILASEVRSG